MYTKVKYFLDKTLNCFYVVCRLITERFFHLPGLRTKHFKSFLLSIGLFTFATADCEFTMVAVVIHLEF